MPTEIMDDWISGLREEERSLVRFLVEPFSFTASALADNAMFLQEEVGLGPVIAIASGKALLEVAESKKTILAYEEAILRQLANEEFEAEFLPEERTCPLSNIARLREMVGMGAVAGLLVAAHDEDCEACGINADDGFDEREEQTANFVAGITLDDQRFLVDHAERLLAFIGDSMSPSERIKLFEDLHATHAAIVVSERCGASCLFVQSFTDDYLEWLSKDTYFLWNPVLHATICRGTHVRLAEFERSHIARLCRTDQEFYEEQATLLTQGMSNRLFTYQH
jgi:hypothetical protein